MIWRPVLAGLDGYRTVADNWDIEELFEAHEALDIKEEAQADSNRRAQEAQRDSARAAR